MAFVDDHLPVAAGHVLRPPLADQALDEGDVDGPGRSRRPAADAPDGLFGDVEEGREARDPLELQLAAVHDDERAGLSRRDDEGGEHRLSKGRAGGQHAFVMREDGVRRALLLGAEFAVEGNVERRAGKAFVFDFMRKAPFAEKVQDGIEASARQGEAVPLQSGARDDAGQAARGKPYPLRVVELRIDERGEPHQVGRLTRGKNTPVDSHAVVEADGDNGAGRTCGGRACRGRASAPIRDK